ncbi:hypothetical protein [Streptomyces palmae]|uniref:Lipoprotein n=1 Tax=Streptomyces palmae TaxID=1701085 RepID=A0A4Z0FWB6_9ACTN|nr:hypothetical protein [Streptomyces palmae]TGA86615.1 hypothetical protein E4099_30380 [Streptomyces palmae]
MSRVVVAAASVAVLGLATACGGSGDDTASDKKAGAKDASQQSAPLSEAQLKKAALTKTEVKGYQIESVGEKELGGGRGAKADKADCQPIAEMFGTEFTPKPAASVFSGFTNIGAGGKDPDKAFDVSELSLGTLRISAYSEADAKKTVTDLKAAIGACTAGLGITGIDEALKLSGVKPEAAPQLGDDAVAFSAKMLDSEEPGMARFDMVRSGSQLTVVMSFHDVSKKHPKAPEALLKAQVAKVERVAGGK